MKKIIKGAVVLLIAAALLFSTVVTADTVKETDESQMNPRYLKSTNPSSSNGNEVEPLGPVMFSQKPYEPEEYWGFYTSSTDAGYICADDFWEVEDEICDIHWWGLSLVYPWDACDPTGMVFEIIFYDMSGNPVCVYQVSPPAVGTGKYYIGFEMYYWETDLDPCCYLPNGWVSIQSISSPNGCWFLWAGSPQGNWNAQQNWAPIDPEDNLAFELTAYGPDPVPLICCDPGITQWKVLPGDPVHGTFHVWNCGDDGSTLTWKVDSWPAWMTSVVFTPPGGNIPKPGPGTDVTFDFIAPTTQQTYSGAIKVINVDDPTDFCEFQVECVVPRAKGVIFNFLEYVLNQFPILKTLFGF